MTIKNIVIDIDDTGYDTYPFFVRALAEKNIDVKNEYITPKNGGQAFIDMLEDATFMYNVEPAHLFYRSAIRLFDMGYKLHICTHRGYTKLGEAFTRKLLSKPIPNTGLCMMNMLTSIHVIDPTVTPNKMEYLDMIFGSRDEYIILDDKPAFNSKIECFKNVLICDKPWNKHFEAPNRFTGFDTDQFYDTIDKMTLRNIPKKP